MNEPEQHEDAVRAVLHRTVDHIHASSELAERAESTARRRRTTRRSVTAAIALIAVGTTTGVLVAAHTGTSSAYSTNRTRLPVCAAKFSAYKRPLGTGSAASGHKATGPVVPGNPVAAIVCRYSDYGDLAGSATVTAQTQLALLQTTMNKSEPYSGGIFCMADTGRDAVIVFTYPQGTADLTVTWNPACISLYTNAGSYLVSSGLPQLITDWTGN